MKWDDAIHEFLQDMESQGRLNSPSSVRAYRDTLQWHRDDIKGGLVPGHRKFEERKQQLTGRNDVKRTLARWKNPNSQSARRSVLVRFYDWCMEEGYRRDNPARMTSRPRKRKPHVYRMTRDEAFAMMSACQTERERRVVHIGICAGFRNAELRSLQVQNFLRPGMIEVIGKGNKYRAVPVIAELEPLVRVILHGEPDDYVIPAQRNRQPGLINPSTGDPWGAARWVDLRKQATCGQTIGRVVARVAARAGIGTHIHPHLMRHAYGDHIARHGGLQLAQYLMGHVDPSTTKTYVDDPRFEDLQAAVGGFTFGEVLPTGGEHTSEGDTNECSPDGSDPDFPQEYRQRDSNPRSHPHKAESGTHSELYAAHDEFEWDEEVDAL